MIHLPRIVAIAIAFASLAGAATEPWHAAYTGQDATGQHVLGLWSFDDAASAAGVKLDGAVLNPNGKFGGCLECFNDPTMRQRHAALVANDAKLSPRGPFSLELWLAAKPDMPKSAAFVLDKKYVAHTDYQVVLEAADKAGGRRVRVSLGFGESTETFYSEAIKLEPNAWHHLALTYDGAGYAALYFDGNKIGQLWAEGRASIAPGKYPLSIGDRVGSNYGGFSGYIDQVRLTSGIREFRRAVVTAAPHRSAYVRFEQVAPIKLLVTNLERTPQHSVLVTASLDGFNEKKFTLERIGPGEQVAVELPVDTSLRPGSYQLRTRVEIPRVFTSDDRMPIHIVARPLPHRMPVLMWGLGGIESVRREMPRLKDLGYTHCFGLNVDVDKIWKAGKPVQAVDDATLEASSKMLDEALLSDLSIMLNISPARQIEADHPELQRVNRKGETYKTHDIDGLFPQVQQFCFNVGASVAQTYGQFPAFAGANIHSEVRGESQVSFHPVDREAYKAATGEEIPELITEKSGLDYRKLKDFPADRVVADDDKLLKYFRWFWNQGDGWNVLHSKVSAGLHTSPRRDLWTFHDPAVRVPSLWGSGGDVDVLAQWTYSYPDPVRLAMPTDELFAMAAGHTPPQRVMKMTQIIWYRSQTAPSNATTAGYETKSPWEDTDPDASFITISPMHLREAFWSEIARPVQGIMNHGWGSLVEQSQPTGYRYTHPQTQHEVRRVNKTIVEPLGPTLMQVGEVKSDIAFLESFTSQMLARRGSYGWGHGWIGDLYMAMGYASLQPQIVYEQTIERDGLRGYKVLVMADCDVLTHSMVEKVRAFQAAGGIVVGDENLCPAIKPDVKLTSVKRTKNADADQKMLIELAAELRSKLDGRYSRALESDDALVVPRLRRAGQSDYLFYVNDHREYGDYVGRFGLVMENGLPASAKLRLKRAGEAFAYDLVNGHAVPTVKTDGGVSVAVEPGPGDGGVILVTPRAIAGIQVDVAGKAQRGKPLDLVVRVVDSAGGAIDAVVPVRVDVIDPDGRAGEFSGYYGAEHGQLKLKLDVASNDVSGVWTIAVKELASGSAVKKYVRVE